MMIFFRMIFFRIEPTHTIFWNLWEARPRETAEGDGDVSRREKKLTKRLRGSYLLLFFIIFFGVR